MFVDRSSGVLSRLCRRSRRAKCLFLRSQVLSTFIQTRTDRSLSRHRTRVETGDTVTDGGLRHSTEGTLRGVRRVSYVESPKSVPSSKGMRTHLLPEEVLKVQDTIYVDPFFTHCVIKVEWSLDLGVSHLYRVNVIRSTRLFPCRRHFFSKDCLHFELHPKWFSSESIRLYTSTLRPSVSES